MNQLMEAARSCKFSATTPKRISPEILTFCLDEIGVRQPTFIPVIPTFDSAHGMCYDNALTEVERNGGEVVIGWLIWELPGLYLTAERHAVVKREDRLRDVTPTILGERKVLFVPTDEDRVAYEPNKYRPLAKHPLLDKFVSLQARNLALSMEGRFSSFEFRRNDAEATSALERYRSMIETRRERKALRAKKKARRQL